MLAERFAASLALAVLVLVALLLAQHSYSRQHDSDYQSQQSQAPRTNEGKADPLKDGVDHLRDQDADSGTKKQPNGHSKETSGWWDWLYKGLHDHDKVWVALGTIVIGVFTVVLSIATIRLAVSTKRLWEAGERQIAVAEKAAKAAEGAARVGAAAERPHMLLIQLTASGLLQPANAEGQVDLTVAYTFQNFGKNPAFLRGSNTRLYWGTDLQPTPTYTELTTVPHIVAPVHGTYYRPPTKAASIPSEIASAIADGRRLLHLYGLLKYDDVLGEPHILRYCYRISFEGKDESVAFMPAGPPSYWEYL